MPFDLVNGPILRVRLVTFDGQRSLVLLAIHHIATDFWSMAALTEEIITSASGGTVTQFPHRSYRQWVREQADYLRSGRGASDKDHWARVLKGACFSSGLEEVFPSAGFRAGDDAGTRLHNFRIDAELSTQLRELAQASDNTLNAVCLAVFQLLLHHRSKRQTLAVGTITSGRTGWEYENTHGYFVNPIPLATELSAQDTFLTFLRRTARDLVDGIVHQAYPFALMVREHATNQRSEQNPFFQAVFLMQQSQHLRGANAFAIKGVSATTHINSVEVTSLPLNLPGLPFELIMTLALTDTGIEAMLEYDGSRMDSTQIASFVREYCALLGAVAGHSEIPVRTLITDVFHRSVQIERPDSAGGGSSVLQNCQSLIEAFEQQVRLVPDNIALTFGDVSLTYLELKERAAGRAAVLLQSARLRRSAPVAILLEPGAELVVSIVAVLMAGACYLPLDPNSPSERLQAILEDSRPDVLLSSQAFAQKLGSLASTAGIRRLFLEELTGGHDTKTPAQVPDADPRAYVIFTSGSTGRPKGVQVTHQNVLRLFTSCEREFNFDSKDVWTLFHSCAFDFSVWEIWGALLYGGRLVVVPYEVTRSPQDFHALVKRERVSVLSQTPSAFKLFWRIDSQQPERLDALRVVVFGGEALLLRNLKGWFEKYGDRQPQLVNMYGITETTVHVTYRLLSPADIEATASPIGKPLNDLTIELVNEHLQRVAGGEVGEIIVSGPGVSLGYLGNESLTRERFIELELDPGQRRRYYLSGDLARQTENGEYEYLGRRDHQVNLNGFRIELGEIESALLKFPGIRSAVVLAQAQLQKAHRIVDSLPRARDEMTPIRQLIRATPDVQEGPATEDKLIAYVVYEIAPEPQALHSHLSRHLPDYMIPVSLIPIDEIPLNQNGKVDVAKLQAQTRNVVVPRAAYVAPQSEEERIWAKLFADILDRPRVGIHEGFFELGGDSIRIIQLRSRALKAGLPVSVQDIFRLQTPAALAAVTQRTHAESERPRVAPFAQIGAHERARMPAGVVDAYPLARLQEGLLFHSLYGNDIAMYCDIFEFRFRGPVDVQAFEAAVAELISRHQIFRTSFNFEDFERPLQLVHEKASCEIRVFDSRALDESARRQCHLQRLEKEKRSTYDVSRAPLIRFSLDRQQDDEFILTMSFHDALLDGWSESATIVELLQNYFDIIARGTVQDRPSINTRFADFVAIEQEVLADPRVREFWEAELEDVIPTMLPLEQGPPASTHQNPVHFLAVDLPAELSDELKAVARQLGVSLKHLLLAAHAAVLSLVCGERDIIMAVESNGRLEDGDGEQVIGSHLNVVPWRIKLDAYAWEELIRIIEQKEAALQPYRRYPYQAIQHLKGNHPLSDVSFNYTHFHLYEHLERYSELKVLDAKAYIQTHFVLRVEFNQDPFTRHLTLDLEANIAAMPAERVRRIAQYYRSALKSIARSPNADFRSAPLLSDEELHEELVASHGRLAPSLADSALYLERFDEQARQHGPQVAAVDAQGSIRYAQLAEGSWRVAASLQSRHVRPGAVIGVIADRCIDYLQVILGIWRVGAVLLPMPIGPVERLRQIVERAEVRLVICSRAYRHFGEQLACPLKPCELEQLCREDLHRRPDPYSPSATDLAYVIFTSGSTGEPKGGMIEHGGMINHIEAKIADIGISRTDKVSQDAAATFDICIWQFCAALLVGGQIRIFEDDIAKDPGNLLSHVKSEGITILEVSPSVLSSMLLHHKSELESIEASRADPQPFRKLRCIVSSGEALQPSLVSELRAVHPDAKILNMWGLTETSDDCTHFLIPPGELTAVSIGMPITNAAIYVLDAWRRLVPRSTPGDLYVGGVCVGRGYVNDAERTAAAFLRNTFDYGSYPRLYRTGDRGFRAQDGSLYFIGRRDNQVKIRGQRIEIGEVEAILSKLPIVHEAVVLALPDASNRLALHAWVVPADGQVAVDGSRVRKLRSEMKSRAPTYMVPDTFVFLEHLPKNAHGKIDRKALAALARTQTQSDTGVVLPQTAAEQTVRELFEQILKRQPVSTDWSFFDIGGNSLLATQLVSRAQRHFGVKLAIRSLFEHDTVAAFAAFVTATAESGAGMGHVIERQIQPARIPLSLNQERIFFIGSIDGSGRAYSSHFALKIFGALDIGALGWALQQIIDRHEILRTTFVLTEEGPEQVVAPSMPFSPTLIDLEPLASADRASALERHLAAEIDRPYQLETLPLCSATIYRLAAQEHVFLWRNHHIIGDGWSAAIMLREIEQLYQAGVRNTPARLPELSIQFADYAIWQRNYVRSERFAQQMQFWKTYLAGQPGVLALPTDLPRPKALTFEGKRLRVEVSEELTTRIRAFCKDSRVTLFAFLQSAIALLLSRYAKQNDLLVGSAVANRHRYEVEPLIGFITNTLPIRHRFDPSSTFAEHVRKVNEDLLSVFENQDVPFAHLVQTFIKERDPGNHPLVQVMFVLQNEGVSLPMIDGLQLEELHRDRFAAIMDLLFDLQESGGGIVGNIEFNANVYMEQTIAVLWRSLTHLMRSIVRSADQQITRLSTIDEDEYRVLNQVWMNLQRGHTEIQFWHRQAVDSPYWEDYLELAERDGLLMSAYLAVSEY